MVKRKLWYSDGAVRRNLTRSVCVGLRCCCDEGGAVIGVDIVLWCG